MRVVEFKLWILFRSEADNFGFLRGKCHGLAQMNVVEIDVEDSLDRMIGGISEFGRKREFRGPVSGVELGICERIPQRDVAAGSEEDFAPDSGVFVGRRGIPVHPGEAEIIFFW